MQYFGVDSHRIDFFHRPDTKYTYLLHDDHSLLNLKITQHLYSVENNMIQVILLTGKASIIYLRHSCVLDMSLMISLECWKRSSQI